MDYKYLFISFMGRTDPYSYDENKEIKSLGPVCKVLDNKSDGCMFNDGHLRETVPERYDFKAKNTKILLLCNKEKEEAAEKLKSILESSRYSDFSSPCLLEEGEFKELNTVSKKFYEFFRNEDIRSTMEKCSKIIILLTSGSHETYFALLNLVTSNIIPSDKVILIRHTESESDKISIVKIDDVPLRTEFISPPEDSSAKKYLQEIHGINFDEIDRYLRKKLVVCLYGPTGTGKTTLFEILQDMNRSGSRRYSFALKGNDMTYVKHELYGYRKGDFTGATKDRKGIIMGVKKDGIIFFDEVNRADSNVLSLVHDFISEGKYHEYNDITTEKKDFKGSIMLSTNIHPLDMVKDKKMPRDFYERIHLIKEFKSFCYLPKEKLREVIRWNLKRIIKNKRENIQTGDIIHDLESPDILDGFTEKLYKTPLPGNFRSIEKVFFAAIYWLQTRRDIDRKNSDWIKMFWDEIPIEEKFWKDLLSKK